MADWELRCWLVLAFWQALRGLRGANDCTTLGSVPERMHDVQENAVPKA